MTLQIMINIGLWLLMLLLIALTKWDYGIIAIGISCLLVITGCVDADTALGMFSDTNVIVIATMMIVSAGFSRTRAIGSIASLLYKVGQDKFENCLRMFMIVNFVLGILLGAAVTRIAIVYPLILAVCRQAGKSPSKAMFPVGVMMLCDQTFFPIGGNAVQYIKFNGFLENAGYTFGDSFSPMDPFFAFAPVCVVMLIYFMFFGIKLAPDEPPRAIAGMKVREQKEREALPHFQEVAAYTIFAVTCILLVFSSKTGIPQWVVTTAAAVLMYLTGVLSMKDGISAIPFSIVWLYIGAIIMGAALAQTGTGLLVGNTIAGMLGGKPSTVVLFLAFWLITMFLTQFMNNGATANMIIPIAIMTCNSIGCSAKGVVLIIQSASLVAWFLPTATAIIPMIIDGGGYDIKSLMKQGAGAALVKTVFQIAWIAILFPAWP